MAVWYYYNEKQEKVGPIRGRELKHLALQGTITPETFVEDEQGRTARAKNVTGLAFSETPTPLPVPPAVPSEAPSFSPTPSTSPSWGEKFGAAASKATEWSKEAYQKAAPHVSATFEKFQDSASSHAPADSFDSFGGQSFRMDYKRNKNYFVPKAGCLPIIVILFGTILLFGGFSEGSVLAILTGLGILALGIFWIIKTLKDNSITDAEIDNICRNYANNLKSMALEKLGIDEDQAKEIEPIQFGFYSTEEIPGTMLPVHYKDGKDDWLRSSNYCAVIFFFSADQIYWYSRTFSLLEEEVLVETDESFYGDIVSVKTKSGVFDRLEGSKETKLIVKVLSSLFPMGTLMRFLMWLGWVKKKNTRFEKFTLTTSGNTEMDAMISATDMATVERSINGMKSLLRSKKQHLERYDT